MSASKISPKTKRSAASSSAAKSKTNASATSSKALTVQPSIFEPLEETLQLTPEQKEAIRTSLTTHDQGFSPIKQSFTVMTYNFFSASKSPDLEPQFIETPEFTLHFTPSVLGAPTLYDADLLMFAASAIAEDVRKNKARLAEEGTLPYKTNVVFRLKDFADRIGRTRGARSMKQLRAALDRLSTGLITIEKSGQVRGTSVHAGQTVGHFFESYKFVEIQEDGRQPVAAIEVRLADWIVKDIATGNMLWFPDGYFRLSPLEKLLFVVARAHIGLKQYMATDANGEERTLPLSLEDLEHEPNSGEGFQVGKAKIDYFYYAVPLPELAEMMRFKQPIKKLKSAILDAIREGNFPLYELAIDESDRALRKNIVYFFRKDDSLRANLLAAELRYPDFKMKYERLTTRQKLLAKEAAKKRQTARTRKTTDAEAEAKLTTAGAQKPAAAAARPVGSLLRRRPKKAKSAESDADPIIDSLFKAVSEEQKNN